MKELTPLFLSIIGAGAATFLFLIGIVQLLFVQYRHAHGQRVRQKILTENPHLQLVRSEENPLLPKGVLPFEAGGVLNPGAVLDTDGRVHIFYRAIGADGISRIGYASSPDGIHLDEKLDHPVFELPHESTLSDDVLRERASLSSSGGSVVGAEDPRAVLQDGRVYLTFSAFYSRADLRITLISLSLEDLRARRFNWSTPIFLSPKNGVHKNWVLFPERINGKYAILHNLHGKERDEVQIQYTDNLETFIETTPPFESIDPKKIAERPEAWHRHIRGSGTPPLRTSHGWLLLYHANDVDKGQYKLGAMLLDLLDPTKILAIAPVPILEPKLSYENEGAKFGVVYACGAVVREGVLMVYYGGSDSAVCVATTPLESFLEELKRTSTYRPFHTLTDVSRSKTNPILSPIPEHSWESIATMNAASIDIDGTIHILYRAMGSDRVSVFGYASSKDGRTIDERLPNPIYRPREVFETRHEGALENSGCEDPRLTRIGDTLYLCYTAYDGVHPPAGALATLSKEKFLKRDFSWSTPKLITPVGANDKDVCIFESTSEGKVHMLHRVEPDICLDTIALSELDNRLTASTIFMKPRPHLWDSKKIGAAGVPIKVSEGWLMIYHGIDGDKAYRLGAALLNEDGTKVLSRTNEPILEPVDVWEKRGNVPDVVFSCGSVLRGDTLFIYYGGADTVLCVATLSLKTLMQKLQLSTIA